MKSFLKLNLTEKPSNSKEPVCGEEEGWVGHHGGMISKLIACVEVVFHHFQSVIKCLKNGLPGATFILRCLECRLIIQNSMCPGDVGHLLRALEGRKGNVINKTVEGKGSFDLLVRDIQKTIHRTVFKKNFILELTQKTPELMVIFSNSDETV